MDKIKRKVIIFAVLFALGFGVYQYFRPYNPSPQTLTSSQQVTMNKINAEMKPYCVGRYMLDLPSSFTAYNDAAPLDNNIWAAVISRPEDMYKTYLATKKMYHPGFVQLIALREKALQNSKTIDAQDMPFLKKVWPLPTGMDGVIFERNENGGAADAMRILEGYIYSNGVVIKFQKQTVNDSASRYERQRNGDPIQNYVTSDVSQMQSLMTRISGRDNDFIPTKPGSCITHAFIATEPTARDQEDINIGLISSTFNNIRVALSTDNFTREENTMLDRMGEITSNISRSRGGIERKGAFSVNGLQAQEFLATGLQEDNDEPRYNFEMYINEMTASYKTPGFILTLDNQRMPPTSYSKGEIIAFWDTISRSVRVRPGAF
ncbi:TPA: T6SS immunity protein Tli4 family protein [Enterobacter roggenkampii]|uniref:T6SS immunity protein Tli4 family protein n=2 Tax=Enterobacter roggenkampii TaxID=1812935 RepID=UPI00254D1490|nr:T6SS immunity protein Tli4 family protein [Enterobacter roggenkampii]MDL0008157.1 T6SS immunity protein Tli4 family protein [Enterobacter roggenkampii]MED5760262.1 T6SS immunity protein Tli4 family protein [Enterobacter roggenkampii]